MSGELLFKILVIAILLFILLSLSGGLFFLIKDKKKNSNRMVTSLSFRVGLSLLLSPCGTPGLVALVSFLIPLWDVWAILNHV